MDVVVVFLRKVYFWDAKVPSCSWLALFASESLAVRTKLFLTFHNYLWNVLFSVSTAFLERELHSAHLRLEHLDINFYVLNIFLIRKM